MGSHESLPPCISHATHMDESCHTHIMESCHTYEWVMSYRIGGMMLQMQTSDMLILSLKTQCMFSFFLSRESVLLLSLKRKCSPSFSQFFLSRHSVSSPAHTSQHTNLQKSPKNSIHIYNMYTYIQNSYEFSILRVHTDTFIWVLNMLYVYVEF